MPPAGREAGGEGVSDDTDGVFDDTDGVFDDADDVIDDADDVIGDADDVFDDADDVFDEADGVLWHEFVNSMTLSHQPIGLTHDRRFETRIRSG